MHSPSTDVRFQEAQKLLNYGFANFANVSFGNKGDIVGTVTVDKGVKSEINAIMEDNASLFISKSKSNQVVQNISFNEKINAPVNEGDILGTATYSIGDEVLKTVNIVASETVKKLDLINMTTNLYNTWFNLLR